MGGSRGSTVKEKLPTYLEHFYYLLCLQWFYPLSAVESQDLEGTLLEIPCLLLFDEKKIH